MEKNNTGLAGEFFVAAELSKKGFQVALTLGNAKEVDLLIRSPNKKTFSVQVKTLRDKNCFDLDPTKITVEDYYVFVFLNAEDQKPDYYVLKGQEIADDREKFYGSSLNVSRPTVNYGPLIPHHNCWGKLPL